ncbi:hypothetical protein NQ317_018514 [Molorchus minor]|uniref:RNA polymerase II subunit A C-terminal domain phosphatase n=1 Tax=Molorchus minor TaxID=1323400 RepID=A0ABQ9J938_9CUCU|nr:hypothetical protein NQ317_018514 [Molorchus minor]
MAEKTVCISQQQSKPIKILKWKIREGTTIPIGRLLLLYDFVGAKREEQRKLKSTQAGTVHKIVAQEGYTVKTGETLLELKACCHPTIINDMCAECGADLRKDDIIGTASVPMVHAIPDLKVSEEQAQILGKADCERLLKDRKLVLLVDLDQTLIHTTNDNIPPNLKDIYHFQLYGPNSPWYHTRLRPGTHSFLNNIHNYYELHICTFGARNYAHTIAMFLDADQKIFSNRILSRDECFDPTSKKANLKSLFPCGDDTVCIIDDREDVWSHASNLIHVKPYHFFKHTGDINAPPGLDKQENDDKLGVDLTKIKKVVLGKEEISDQEIQITNGTTEERLTKNKINGEPVKKEEHTEDNKGEKRKSDPDIYQNEEKTEEKDKEANGNDSIKDDASSDITEDKSKIIITGNPRKVGAIREFKKDETVVTIQSKDAAPTPLEKNKEIDEENCNPEGNLIEVDDPDDYLIYLEEILKKNTQRIL